MADAQSTDYTGTPIEPDQAWRTFDDWKNGHREIGVIYFGASGVSLHTIGVVASARNGTLRLQNGEAKASFNLKQANFRYGPFLTWPNWPNPPIVRMTAIRAAMENGDCLILAEDRSPHSANHLSRLTLKSQS